MNYIIRKANLDETSIADSFLTKLIRDEKKYDNNINENIVINNYYENVIGDNNCLLFAQIENTIVGYIYGFIRNDGNTVFHKVACLDALYVDANYRNQGIANALIAEFKKWAKASEVKYMEVSACSKNENAVTLYRKNDFKDIKVTMECEL